MCFRSHDLLDVTSQSTVSNALTDINLGAVESQVLLPLKPSQKQFSVHTPDLTSVDYSLDKIHVSLNSIRPSTYVCKYFLGVFFRYIYYEDLL